MAYKRALCKNDTVSVRRCPNMTVKRITSLFSVRIPVALAGCPTSSLFSLFSSRLFHMLQARGRPPPKKDGWHCAFRTLQLGPSIWLTHTHTLKRSERVWRNARSPNRKQRLSYFPQKCGGFFGRCTTYSGRSEWVLQRRWDLTKKLQKGVFSSPQVFDVELAEKLYRNDRSFVRFSP